MGRISIGRLVLLAGVACLAVAIPALAQPNTVHINSTVTLANHAPAFHGRVKSPNDACEQGRKVKMFQQQPGPDDLLGHDTTNGQGQWLVPFKPGSGAFYAKVKRREEGTAGTIYVCRGDKSGIRVID
jgi:hypothetical protein